MVAGDAAHAGGDFGTQRSVVGVVIKSPVEWNEHHDRLARDGSCDAKFTIFFVVTRKGEEVLPVAGGFAEARAGGAEDSPRIQPSAQPNSGPTEKRQGPPGDCVLEGRGKLLGQVRQVFLR